MEEIAPGIWHWTAIHPRIGLEVSSYFLAGPDALLDPLGPPDDDRLDELGPPREILLTNRHHLRNSLELAERFGCPIRAPEPGMHEFSDGEPVEPYAFGEELAGGADQGLRGRRHLSRRSGPPHPVAERACGRRRRHPLRRAPIRRPTSSLDEPEQTKKHLKAAYGRLAEELDFDHLLLAHGDRRDRSAVRG